MCQENWAQVAVIASLHASLCMAYSRKSSGFLERRTLWRAVFFAVIASSHFGDHQGTLRFLLAGLDLGIHSLAVFIIASSILLLKSSTSSMYISSLIRVAHREEKDDQSALSKLNLLCFSGLSRMIVWLMVVKIGKWSLPRVVE